MKIIKNETLTGERAAFFASDTRFENCVFTDGESPLKHASLIEVIGGAFSYKYPLWYVTDAHVKGVRFDVDARAGVWYTRNAIFEDLYVNGPKNFRKCENIQILHSKIPAGAETLWACDKVKLSDVEVEGDYLCKDANNLTIDHLTLKGKYPFDGCKNIIMTDSVLDTKDAFWNCENVTLIRCKVIGEYFGWNSKNITLIDCEVSSHQGFCYIEGLTLKNCRLKGTDLSFEYCSDIDAEFDEADSIKNPSSGVIKARRIGEVILDEHQDKTRKTQIEIAEK